jgi:hypothetical protein
LLVRGGMKIIVIHGAIKKYEATTVLEALDLAKVFYQIYPHASIYLVLGNHTLFLPYDKIR